MVVRPVSLGLHSDVCTWHWLCSWWKEHGNEASAFTLFHQLRVSSKAGPWGGQGSGFREMNERRSQIYFAAAVYHCWGNLCWNFPWGGFTLHAGKCIEEKGSARRKLTSVYSWWLALKVPGHTLHFHGHWQEIPLGKAGYWEDLGWAITASKTEKRSRSAYLNYTHAGVQENGSFGLLGDLLIFVEVQIVRAIPELGQMEIPPLEWLKGKVKKMGIQVGTTGK